MPDTPRLDWRFAAVAMFVLTCLFTIQSMGLVGGPPLGAMHQRQLITWLIWLALLPAILWTARLPSDHVARASWLGRHLLLGCLFALASAAIAAGLRALFGVAVRDALGPSTPVVLASNFAGDFLRYALIAVTYQAYSYHRAVRMREAQAAQLRADLAEAKVANLEGRLQPHFLFNTLNSIAALVREDPRAAETMVEQLSELLRATLQAQPLHEVPLDEELRLTEQYLAIQRVRFQERLRTTVEAGDEARRGRVPQLILQPLVENAVRHGLAPLEAGGSVAVKAVVEGDRLIVTVEDDGVGVGNAPPSAGSGLGLGAAQSRLAHLYGKDQQFLVCPRSPSGTTVTITMPWRPASA